MILHGSHYTLVELFNPIKLPQVWASLYAYHTVIFKRYIKSILNPVLSIPSKSESAIFHANSQYMETAPYLDAGFIEFLAILALVHEFWYWRFQLALKYRYSAYTGEVYPYSSPE